MENREGRGGAQGEKAGCWGEPQKRPGTALCRREAVPERLANRGRDAPPAAGTSEPFALAKAPEAMIALHSCR